MARGILRVVAARKWGFVAWQERVRRLLAPSKTAVEQLYR